MKVRAQLVADIDADGLAPGSFEYFTNSAGRFPAGMLFTCPCGCGMLNAIDFKPHDSPSWRWDGNIEQPTLTPSLNISQEHWHGFLTGGEFHL